MTKTTDRRAHPEAALAEVLDCDREVYAAVYQDKAPKYADQARAGDFDTTPLVQAFARHRIAATQSLSTDLDKAQSQLVDAEQRLAMVEGLLGEWRDMHEDDPCHFDHHGYCQEHYLEDDCIVKRTRAALNPQPTCKDISMIDATPEQLDLARKIVKNHFGTDNGLAIKIALAAIIETSERACDAVEDYCSDMPDLAGYGHSIGLKDAIRSI